MKNISPCVGVTWSDVRGKWVAQISTGKHRQKFLGAFDDMEIAVRVRKRADKEKLAIKSKTVRQKQEENEADDWACLCRLPMS